MDAYSPAHFLTLKPDTKKSDGREIYVAGCRNSAGSMGTPPQRLPSRVALAARSWGGTSRRLFYYYFFLISCARGSDDILGGR